jgi:hypothetical protein
MIERFLLSLLPVSYLIALIWRTVRGKWRDATLSVAMVGATLAGGVWALSWTRSSPGWAELFLLPSVAGAAGLLVLAYGGSRGSRRWAIRLLGQLALAPALALSVAMIFTTWRADRRRDTREAEAMAQWGTVLAERERIATMPRDTVEELILERWHDRNFVLTAMKRPDLSPALLDTLATEESDLDILVTAIQHANTRSETLARVYQTSPHRQFVFHLLAAHRNTPPQILRELYALKPPPVSTMDEAFAGNPATPPDILDEIARTTTRVQAAMNLLENPSIGCQVASHVATGPAATSGYGSDRVRERAAKVKSTLCR